MLNSMKNYIKTNEYYNSKRKALKIRLLTGIFLTGVIIIIVVLVCNVTI